MEDITINNVREQFEELTRQINKLNEFCNSNNIEFAVSDEWYHITNTPHKYKLTTLKQTNVIKL